MNSYQQDMLDLSDLQNQASVILPPPVVETPREEPVPEETNADTEEVIRQKFYSRPGAPSFETVEAWKQKWGADGIFVISISDTDTFALRYITTTEWQQLQSFMKDSAAKAQGNEQVLAQIDDMVKKKIVQTCCLWPRIADNFFLEKRAGLLEQLHYVIMVNSYFFAPQQALTFTAAL